MWMAAAALGACSDSSDDGGGGDQTGTTGTATSADEASGDGDEGGDDGASSSDGDTGGDGDTGTATGDPGTATGGTGTATGGTGTTSGADCEHDGSQPTATVSSISELHDAIANAADGAVIWVNPGTYTCVTIENLMFTRAAPLIIRKNPDEAGTVTFDAGGCYFNTRVSSSSYVALDGITVDGGGAGVWIEASHHVILRDLTVQNPGQEGIRLRRNSSHVDILGCHVFDTGRTNEQYGECVYVGTGGGEDFPDQTEHVWIEHSEFHHCGASEGVNVKSEAFHVTVRNNDIHHITPGTPSQYNQSALTVEGAGRPENHRPEDPRDVWIEDNDISNVTFGQWASGMMVGGTGVNVLRNTVTSYEEWGIYVNGFGNLGLPVHVYDNQVDDSGQGDYSFAPEVDVQETDPGPNPNTPQNWYCP
jgi:hypothetical protein